MLKKLDISFEEENKNLVKVKIQFDLLKNKINKLCGKKERCWSEEEYNFLLENYRKMPLDDICAHLNKPKTTVIGTASKLGLTKLFMKPTEIILDNLVGTITGRNCYIWKNRMLAKWGLKMRKIGGFYIVDLNDFFEWYKSHLRIIGLWAYNGQFPNAPEWFNEKARADKRAYVYMERRKWTEDEDNALKQMIAERKNYFEISTALKRTGPAIKRRCYDLKIPKPKRLASRLWTESEMKQLKTLWLRGYEPCIIAEEIGRGDRQIISMLERNRYFGTPPQKFCYC